jgi:hypothetical protein
MSFGQAAIVDAKLVILGGTRVREIPVSTLVDTLKRQSVVLESVPSAQALTIQLFRKRMSRK